VDLHAPGDYIREVTAEHSPKLVEFLVMPRDDVIEFLAGYASHLDWL
jgi:hypothetical protein